MTTRDKRLFEDFNDSVDTWIVIAIMLVVRFGIPYAIGFFVNKCFFGGTLEENRMIASVIMFGTVILESVIRTVCKYITKIREDKI